MILRIVLLIFLSFSFLSCGSLSSKWQPQGVRDKEKSLKVVWAKNFDPEYQTGNLPIALNSPLIYEGILFIGNGKGYMQAFELENGRKIWSHFEGSPYYSSPVIFDEHIIYGNAEGRLFARHYLTGKLKYSVDLGSSVESKGVVYKGRIFFHLRNHKIFCLDANTGKILWAYRRSVPFLTTIQRVSRPLVIDDSLFVGFADGYVAAFNIDDGVLLWDRKLASGSKFIDVDVSPVIWNNSLLVGSLAGDLMVIDRKSGKTLRRLNHSISRAPIKFGDKLILGTTSGELILMDQNLSSIKTKKIAASGISSIVKWKKQIAVSTLKGELLIINPLNFNLLEKHHLGHTSSSVFGALVVKENKLAVLSSRYRLYVYK